MPRRMPLERRPAEDATDDEVGLFVFEKVRLCITVCIHSQEDKSLHAGNEDEDMQVDDGQITALTASSTAAPILSACEQFRLQCAVDAFFKLSTTQGSLDEDANGDMTHMIRPQHLPGSRWGNCE
jgi:hypothetical protein